MGRNQMGEQKSKHAGKVNSGRQLSQARQFPSHYEISQGLQNFATLAKLQGLLHLSVMLRVLPFFYSGSN